ncbi:MAG TPA: VWA-like domain-containing protein, partial [Thermoleophilia bacterium]|nr:VWA-like domain-containing protein [Thermoleophilia bacterium]
CDAAVHGDVEVEDAYDVEIKGGGGSDFNPAFELLREDGFTGAVVAFTDGMIGVPDEKPPGLQGCLWLCPKGYTAPTESWGDFIEMPDDCGRDDDDE